MSVLLFSWHQQRPCQNCLRIWSVRLSPIQTWDWEPSLAHWCGIFWVLRLCRVLLPNRWHLWQSYETHKFKNFILAGENGLGSDNEVKLLLLTLHLSLLFLFMAFLSLKRLENIWQMSVPFLNSGLKSKNVTKRDSSECSETDMSLPGKTSVRQTSDAL